VLEPKLEKRTPLFFLPLLGGSSRDTTQQQLAKLLSGNKPVVAFDIQGARSPLHAQPGGGAIDVAKPGFSRDSPGSGTFQRIPSYHLNMVHSKPESSPCLTCSCASGAAAQ
jgi:hypothetical protein